MCYHLLVHRSKITSLPKCMRKTNVYTGNSDTVEITPPSKLPNVAIFDAVTVNSDHYDRVHL